jgi:hypothetical protein
MIGKSLLYPGSGAVALDELQKGVWDVRELVQRAVPAPEILAIVCVAETVTKAVPSPRADQERRPRPRRASRDRRPSTPNRR